MTTKDMKEHKGESKCRDNPRKAVALLLYRHVGHLQLRISLIPITADVFEGQSERLALARGQRRDVEVNRIGIRSAGLQNAESNVFGLGDLVERVPKSNMDDRVHHRLVTRVGHSSVDVSNASANKILGRAHFQIREPEVGSVRMWSGRTLRIATREPRDGTDNDYDERDPQHNWKQIRIALLLTLGRRLDEAAHSL